MLPLCEGASDLLLRCCFSAPGHRATRATLGPCVSFGPLPTDWKVPAMSKTAIAADLRESLDIERNFPAQITLDAIVAIDDFAQALNLVLGQLMNARVGIYACLRQDLLTDRRSDS